MARSIVALFCLLAACTETTNLVTSRASVEAGDAPSNDGGSERPEAGQDLGPDLPDAGELADASMQAGAGAVTWCGNVPCACSNGIDDDLDGQKDGFDGECTGPHDNDERTFATGEVKDGNPKCEDCFFDHTPGSGDDGCYIATSCLTTGQPTSGTGRCNTCTPTSTCINSCRPATPNGCDCFGCVAKSCTKVRRSTFA